MALIVLISMEFGIIKEAQAFFSESTDSGLAKAGSILAILVLLYAAFPIAKLIRTRGESLGESHNGMLTFAFSDFIKTNIRMMGEVAAILVLAFMYINLAIYGYLFNIVASIVKWVSSTPLPISIGNKNV